MSRPIKFRVWDKDRCRFEYFEIGENDDCYGMFRVAANKFGSVVEQYTGLKDKNGIEIYEGDIVKGEMGVFEVKWYGLVAQFMFKPNLSMKYHPPFNSEQLKVMEVIGNIHENPEWLGGEE